MSDLGQTAVGSWSGGRFMRFGQPIDDDRFQALLRPDEAIPTVLTADVYGTGEADLAVGAAIKGLPRESFNLVGAVGHDFVSGERQGAKGFPRFTDPALRGPSDYLDYLREAVEASLERCGVDHFDVLLLHNPDRTGFGSTAVWDAMATIRDAGLADSLGVAPGPANGFTLDLISCLERHGEVIDWAMLILNPLEPWPGNLALPACEANGVKVIARVVDYGGLFHGDIREGHPFPQHDHRNYRPQGWVKTGLAKIERMRPIAEQVGLTPLQLACAWDLANPAVECVVPTLIEEGVDGCRPIEDQRADLAALPQAAGSLLSDELVATLREIGDNTNCMGLKGGTPDHSEDELPDRWALDADLIETGRRWNIAPADLALSAG